MEAHVACQKTGAGVLEVELGVEGEQHEGQAPGRGDLSDVELLRRLQNLLQGSVL